MYRAEELLRVSCDKLSGMLDIFLPREDLLSVWGRRETLPRMLDQWERTDTSHDFNMTSPAQRKRNASATLWSSLEIIAIFDHIWKAEKIAS